MSHYDLIACFKIFCKTYRHVRHHNKIYLIKLDQDYQMILRDKTSFPIVSLNMNDRHVKVQDQNNIVPLLHVYKHYFSYDYD